MRYSKNNFFLHSQQVILGLVAFSYIMGFLYMVLLRINYPYELEWMEGAMVDHVLRVLNHQALYTAPSIEYTPYIYPPFFYFLSAQFAKFLGVGFFPLRLVSFISSIGILLLIFQFVRKETGSIYYGGIAAGFFAATFELSGAWLDLGRVDSLSLFLLLAGCYLLRFHPGTLPFGFSGLLFSLSLFTKQTALFVILPLSLFVFVFLPTKYKLIFFSTFILTSGIFTYVFQIRSDGWFLYYIWELPQQHEMNSSNHALFWILGIGKVFLAFLISIFPSISLGRKKDMKSFAFYSIFLVSTVMCSWITSLHVGSYNNALIPAYGSIAILFGIGLSELSTSFTQNMPNISNKDKESKYYYRYPIFLVIIFIQFAALIYNPKKYVPSLADIKAGDYLVEMISNLKGDVYIPSHEYLTHLSGKNSYAHDMAIADVLRGEENEIKEKLLNYINQAIITRKFDFIIADSNRSGFNWLEKGNYKLLEIIFDDLDVFWPVSGYRTRPDYLYR